MKPALALLVLVLAVATAFLPSPAYAQIELTEADPPDGAQLDAPPEVVHLCFSEPANIEDNTTYGFRFVMPDGSRLGLRSVFQPSGECVNVFPGLPEEPPAGKYTLKWQVTAAQGNEQGSGTLKFKVTEAATPTPSLSPTPDSTSPPATPTLSPSPTLAPTPPPATPTPEAGGADEADDGPDILLVALITIAAIGGAAVLFTLGYFLRKRIGYEPHRPPEGGEGGGDH